MNYFLGIDIAKTNHVASLINNNGDVVIRAIKFTNSNEGFNKLLNTIQSKLGDLSNIEYYAAKRDKNKNESRIRYLERMIKNAEIITDNSRDDEVGLNNTVQLYMEEDDETETYKLVTSIRGNSLFCRISTGIPHLGKAILGHKDRRPGCGEGQR